MNDVKLNALVQAIVFHTSLNGAKKATAEQIVGTAKKFEAFLAPGTAK